MIPSKKLAKTQLISDKFCGLTVVKSAPSRTKQNNFLCFSAFPTSARTFLRSIDLPSRPTLDAQRRNLQQSSPDSGLTPVQSDSRLMAICMCIVLLSRPINMAWQATPVREYLFPLNVDDDALCTINHVIKPAPA